MNEITLLLSLQEQPGNKITAHPLKHFIYSHRKGGMQLGTMMTLSNESA